MRPRTRSATPGLWVFRGWPDDLDPIYDRIVTELDSQYYLAYSTDRDLSSLDLRDLEVSVAGDDLEVRAVAAPKQPGG